MKRAAIVSLIGASSLTLVVAGAAAHLDWTGQDSSAPPAVKAPPAREVPVTGGSVSLSPANWDADKLAALFERNARMGDAGAPAIGSNGAIAGTTGAPAVHAGLTALENGGSAIDALLTASLAQIALAMGSWVSYAGILELVYYDAVSGEIYNLNAGYNSFLGEDDPLSIPSGIDAGGNPSPSGRTALVPGFFAGAQAAHDKFGRLPFSSLFGPAIYIAEEGMKVTSFQEALLARRKNVLSRLPETKAVFARADGAFLRQGDLLKQTALAKTLKAVAEQGADYIYTGPWARNFVSTVQAEGGKVTLEDMERYEVIWQEPLAYDFGDYRLYLHGRPAQGGTHLAESLNLAQVSGLAEMGDYRESPEAFFWFAQFTHPFGISFVPSNARGALFPGLDTRMHNRATKDFAESLWSRMSKGEFMLTAAPRRNPRHSDAVVVIDQWGNIAAATHTINTSSWGATGIFVDGVSVPDSASFQQAALAELEPGSRLPDPTQPVILFKNGRPIGGFSSIGSGLHQKTFTVLYNIMAYGASLEEAMAAPSTHLPAFGSEGLMKPPAVQVVEGEFSAELLEQARAMGLDVKEFPATLGARAPRGYVVGAMIRENGDYEAIAPKLFNAPAEAY